MFKYSTALQELLDVHAHLFIHAYIHTIILNC